MSTTAGSKTSLERTLNGGEDWEKIREDWTDRTVQRWVEKHEAFGSSPSVERYRVLFDDEALLYDPGEESPFFGQQILDHIQTVLSGVDDFHFTQHDWASNGRGVYVESRNEASLGGTKIVWPAVYHAMVKGDSAVYARRFYDRLYFLETMFPDHEAIQTVSDTFRYVPEEAGSLPDPVPVTRSEFLERYIHNWRHPDPDRFAAFYHPEASLENPGMKRPLTRSEMPGYYKFVLETFEDLRMQPVFAADSDDVMFVEWSMSARLRGREVSTRIVDRFTFRDNLVVDGRAFFDRLTLVRPFLPETFREKTVLEFLSEASASGE